MNRTLLATLPGMLLLAGCVVTPPSPVTGAGSISGCQTQSKALVCPPSGVVNINLNKAGGSAATPECVTAKRGGTVTLHVNPPPAKVGAVITLPEVAANGWLVASNVDGSAKDKIVIEVPEDAAEGEHKYYVLSDAGVCLDPRFIIER